APRDDAGPRAHRPGRGALPRGRVVRRLRRVEREVRGGPTGREAFRRRGGAGGIPPGLRGGGPGAPRRAVRAGDGGARLGRKLHLAALSGAGGTDPRVGPRDPDGMSHTGFSLSDTP